MYDSIFSIDAPIARETALNMHPMTLAFIGDGVQSLYARTRAALSSDSKTGVLHKQVTSVVKAVAQAATAERLLPQFDSDEADVFRRARNCRIQTSAKHADMSEYRRASGFEAVIGFNYLIGNTKRLVELLDAPYED